MEYTVREKELPTYLVNVPFGERGIYGGKTAYMLGSDGICALHYHESSEIGICLCGSGECHVGGRVYRYRRGCVEIVPRGVPHLANSDEGVESRWKWVHFDERRIMAEAGLLDPDGIISVANKGVCLSGVFDEEELGEIGSCAKRIIDSIGVTDELTTLSTALAVGDFLIACYRRRESFPEAEKYVSAPRGQISSAVDYISCHLDLSEELGEERLAEQCSMSVSNFRRVFTLTTGMSPKRFIIHSRMAYAGYLLRKTRLSALEISERVGYNDFSGFNRMFKATFGVSVREYRRGIDK